MMPLEAEHHEPTLGELKAHPDFVDIGIANEILLCPCSKKHSWFDLRLIVADIALSQGVCNN